MTTKLEKYLIYIVIAFGISMFVKPVLCPLILGSVFVYISVACILFMHKLQKSGIECRGRILSFERGDSGSKTPVVEFRALNGELVTKTPFIYGLTHLDRFPGNSYGAHTEVRVLYDPNDPKRFVLKDEESFSYFFTKLILIAGLLFITFSLATLLGYINLF